MNPHKSIKTVKALTWQTYIYFNLFNEINPYSVKENK